MAVRSSMAAFFNALSVLVALVALPLSVQAGASGTFLASRAAAKSAARKRFHAAAESLASALQSELDTSLDFPLLVSAARDLLRHKAESLRSDDGLGADLLDSYALRAPPLVLVLPVAANFDVNKTSGEKRVKSHRVSSKTVCEGGKCVTETTEDFPDGKSNTTRQERDEKDLGQSGLVEAPGGLDSSIGQLVKEMKHMDSTFGMDKAWAHMLDKDEMWPKLGKKSHGKTDWDVDDMTLLKPLSEDFKISDGFSSSDFAQGNSTMESFSKSSESHMENGTLVTKTKSCKNGNCTTEVTKKKLPAHKTGQPLLMHGVDAERISDGFLW